MREAVLVGLVVVLVVGAFAGYWIFKSIQTNEIPALA